MAANAAATPKSERTKLFVFTFQWNEIFQQRWEHCFELVAMNRTSVQCNDHNGIEEEATMASNKNADRWWNNADATENDQTMNFVISKGMK